MRRIVLSEPSPLVRSVEILRDVLREIDQLPINADIGLHLQWAIDLLAEAQRMGQVGSPII
jgi:hypothetical protein